MRIGIVTEYYRPWPGGISEHVYHEAKELRRRGHKAIVITGPASGRRPEGETGVLRVGFALKLPRNRTLCRITIGRYMLIMRRLLSRLRLDVLHIHSPLDPVLGMVALAASETATVGTFHANFESSLAPALLYRGLRPLPEHLFERLHVLIAVSEEARRSIARYFPGEYEIVPNGVDTERFHPAAPPLSELAGHPTVLFVGRPDPRKGLPLLLQAFPQVVARVAGARLVVVGGVGRQKIDELKAELPPEIQRSVLFAGYAAPEVLPRYFTSCNVFCSPATGQESFGIVLLEAMAAGRPLVAFDIPGYREVVRHGKDGWLVPQIGPEPLAEALVGLLQNPSLRKQMGEAGRQKALTYSWPRIVERIEACFMKARAAAAQDAKAMSQQTKVGVW
ncbi:MAG: glycosyltransferase family 4 protein [Anaerolineae bacterium]|nr:glycosyltransferase family 4 protein [Anaerolineae bacterium]